MRHVRASQWIARSNYLRMLLEDVVLEYRGIGTSRALSSIPGVGLIVSLSFIATNNDVARFHKATDVGAHLGLTPRRYQSGEPDWSGRIRPHGCSNVPSGRWPDDLVVECQCACLNSGDFAADLLEAPVPDAIMRRNRPTSERTMSPMRS